MALGRQGERQSELMVGWAELPRSPGHVFYDRLQAGLIEAGFTETIQRAAELAGAAARPITDMRGTAAQRRHLVGVLTTRVLQGAIARARGQEVESAHVH